MIQSEFQSLHKGAFVVITREEMAQMSVSRWLLQRSEPVGLRRGS